MRTVTFNREDWTGLPATIAIDDDNLTMDLGEGLGVFKLDIIEDDENYTFFVVHGTDDNDYYPNESICSGLYDKRADDHMFHSMGVVREGKDKFIAAAKVIFNVA